MKIMRLGVGRGNRDGQDTGSFDRNCVVLILKDAIDAEEFLAVDHLSVFFVEIGIHNHVRNSSLIFQTQKDKTLGCTRALSRDHASGHPCVLSVRQAC